MCVHQRRAEVERADGSRRSAGKCFICGIDRFIFDQASAGGNGFENHVSQDHNMWRYFFFFFFFLITLESRVQ